MIGYGAALAGPLVVGLPAVAAAKRLTVVKASDFGYSATDSTTYLQAALDSGADTVVIDKVPAGPWISGPLFVNANNVQIILERGVVLQAKVGGFPGLDDSMISINNKTGVSIVGYGASIVMNKPEYTTGEWRMALMLLSVTNFTIEGLSLYSSGGDGIYVGVSSDLSAADYCQNVTIRNVVCDDHRRNAISVISVDGLLIEGSVFSNTAGTSPQAGIDFEPNLPTERLTGIQIKKSIFTGNVAPGFQVVPVNLTSTSTPISITVTDTLIARSTSDHAIVTFNIPGTTDPGGSIDFVDCLVVVGPMSGTLAVWNKSAFGTDLTFDRTIWWSAGTSSPYYGSPMYLRNQLIGGVDPAPEYGGVTWANNVVHMDYPHVIPGAVELPGTLGATGLDGTLTVFNPYGVVSDLGSNPHGNTLVVDGRTSTPASTVEVSTVTGTIPGGGSHNVVFTRSSADLSLPCAVEYELTGTARPRDDYHGMSGHVIIPAGSATATLNVQTRVSDDPGTRSIVLTVKVGQGYTVGANDQANFSVSQ